ncbi:hypothetical protein RHGRI_037405 [Rhododendron griersonianum]|uniref:Non-specific serine/threonine protein kinase n=1 Tax=Rhododendron griersonianum TaxID=479676 RepID=A0AAV6HX24_9ERIC|nr:hypothetical protein RHGRI_037405 [Rhododendron griersonianum]
MGISSRAPTSTFCWSALFMFFYFFLFCSAANNITQGQSIRDGETIISAGQKFVLGFFSPGNSTYRYVGIWFDQIPVQSVVWVANRENPISGEAGVMKLEDNGNLVVLDGNGNSVWSSNTSSVSNRTTAILRDTGDLILSDSDKIGDPNKAFWQSFNDPTDSYLPDMRIHMNVESGENRVFTSWKTASDPSLGQYSMGVDPRGSPQIVIWNGLDRRWRSGHWNGLIFTGVPTMKAIYLYGFKLSNEGNGNLSFTYTKANSSDLVWFRIRWDGNEEQLWWNQERNEWSTVQLQPANECEAYNKCGSFGNCFATESPMCGCIEGFVPMDANQWGRGNWTGGCVRRTDLQCETNSTATGEVDGFLKIEGVKLPDFADSIEAENRNDCEEECLKNCSCNAYAFESGIRCMTWSGELTDIQHFVEGGSDLHIRLANSELECLFPFDYLVTAVSTSRWKNRQSQTNDARSSEFSTDFSGPDELGVERHQCHAPEFSVVSFRDIAAATDNFSDENKLGKGGFGIVYKAWDLWDSGKAMELIDPSVAGSCYPNEALRCVHVAMLCVQDSAGDRPTMSSVVLMLESENATLPMPRQPTFTSMRSSRGVDVLKENQDVASSNDVTISLIIGR